MPPPPDEAMKNSSARYRERTSKEVPTLRREIIMPSTSNFVRLHPSRLWTLVGIGKSEETTEETTKKQRQWLATSVQLALRDVTIMTSDETTVRMK